MIWFPKPSSLCLKRLPLQAYVLSPIARSVRLEFWVFHGLVEFSLSIEFLPCEVLVPILSTGDADSSWLNRLLGCALG